MRVFRLLLVFLFVGVLPALLLRLGADRYLDLLESDRERQALQSVDRSLNGLKLAVLHERERRRLVDELMDRLTRGEAAGSVETELERNYPGMFSILSFRGQIRPVLSGSLIRFQVEPDWLGVKNYRYLWGILADYLAWRSCYSDRNPPPSEKKVKLLKQILGTGIHPESVFDNRDRFVQLNVNGQSCWIYWNYLTPDWRAGVKNAAAWKGLVIVRINEAAYRERFGLDALIREETGRSDKRWKLEPVHFRQDADVKSWTLGEPGLARRWKRSMQTPLTYRGSATLYRIFPVRYSDRLFLVATRDRESIFAERRTIEQGLNVSLLVVILILTGLILPLVQGRWRPYVSIRIQLVGVFVLVALIPIGLLIRIGVSRLTDLDTIGRQHRLEILQQRVRHLDNALRENLDDLCSQAFVLRDAIAGSVEAYLREISSVGTSETTTLRGRWLTGVESRLREYDLQANLDNWFIYDSRGEAILTLPQTRSGAFLSGEVLRFLSAAMISIHNTGHFTPEARSTLSDNLFGLVSATPSGELSNSLLRNRGIIHTLDLFGQRYHLFFEPILNGENRAVAAMMLIYNMQFHTKDVLGRMVNEALADADGTRLHVEALSGDNRDFPNINPSRNMGMAEEELKRLFEKVVDFRQDYLGGEMDAFVQQVRENRNAVNGIIHCPVGPQLAWGAPLQVADGYLAVAFSPLDQIRHETEQAGSFLLLALLAVFFAAVTGGLVIARRVIRPVRDMQSGVQAVARGELDYRMQGESRDEFGELTSTFNEMITGLQEKERMSRFVSDFVRNEVKREDAGERPGERREVTILFSDIRGFTTLSESHPAEEIVILLNEYLTRMTEAIQDHGGVVDKFIGDAVMAVFDRIENQPPHAERALRAALAMRESLAGFNVIRQASGLFPIENGIGINTGEVIMGSIGARGHRVDLTVIGDAVNVAARLEAASKDGRHTRIILAESTRSRVAHLVETTPMMDTHVRGRQEAVDMVEVVRWIGIEA